ncbi:MAG: type II secretion system GspH family protein [Pyrinomonadaceae bacterium MAG19_C2-C3]|nr:type II secretion system GspH family protein [Pyrinomonadaceae bacterium MAG19_C2-C3]
MNLILNHEAQEANRALSRRRYHQHDERGYALLALMVAMAILVILLSAAAPVLKHEAQRERELEAIRRGEQVAQAIRSYTTLTKGRLPTSMDELLEGAQTGRTRKTQVLRRSSMRDPLSPDGEWRTIKQNDRAMQSFCNDVRRYAETLRLDPSTTLPLVLQQEQTRACSVPINLGVAEPLEPEPLLSDAPSSGPFVGVASQSQNTSIINYYGIDKHSRWIFTPLFR